MKLAVSPVSGQVELARGGVESLFRLAQFLLGRTTGPLDGDTEAELNSWVKPELWRSMVIYRSLHSEAGQTACSSRSTVPRALAQPYRWRLWSLLPCSPEASLMNFHVCGDSPVTPNWLFLCISPRLFPDSVLVPSAPSLPLSLPLACPDVGGALPSLNAAASVCVWVGVWGGQGGPHLWILELLKGG